MKSYIQILATPTADSAPSILAVFDTQKYLFNVGEAAQRLCLERKIRLAKVKNIFVTRVAWECVGGIPGMLLTLADAGNNAITVHGGKNLTHFLAAARNFVFRMSAGVSTNELHPHSMPYGDENVDILPVFIHESNKANTKSLKAFPPIATNTPGIKRKYDAMNVAETAGENADMEDIIDSFNAFKEAKMRHSGQVIEEEADAEEPPAFHPMQMEAPATELLTTFTTTNRMIPYSVSKKRKATAAANGGTVAVAVPTPSPAPAPPPVQQPRPQPFIARKEILTPAQRRKSAARDLRFKQDVVGMMFVNGEKISIPMGASFEAASRGSWKGGPEARNQAKAASTRARDIERIPATTPSKTAICYIAQGPTVAGKFFPDKAKELGVRPGREFGQLFSGEPLSLKPGETIYPYQVQGSEKLGHIFMVVDCPSVDYVDSLILHDRFEPHYAATTNNPVGTILHALGDGVLDSPKYRAWLRKFGDTTHHIILSRKHSPQPIVFIGSAVSQCRLNNLDPDVFTVPFYNNTPIPFEYDDIPPQIKPNLTLAVPMMIHIMEPKPALDLSEVKSLFDHLDPEGKMMTNMEKMTGFLERCREVKSGIGAFEEKEKSLMDGITEVGGDDVEMIVRRRKLMSCNVRLTTLGTGAALPSRYRNVSSTHLHIPGYGGILMDAGEGTYGQLFRKFGGDRVPELKLDDLLMTLRILFISHMHADHHLGAIGVLLERARAFQAIGKPCEPLYVVGPPKYLVWLQEYSEVEDFGFDNIIFLRSADLLVHRNVMGYHDYESMLKVTGFTEFRTVVVEHCPNAFALIMTHTDGWKVVFSGDCRPSEELVRFGKDADVLIHESTFEDDHCIEAVRRRHSTIGEAIQVSAKMRAAYLLLTHFSQRYPKVSKEVLAAVKEAAGGDDAKKDDVVEKGGDEKVVDGAALNGKEKAEEETEEGEVEKEEGEVVVDEEKEGMTDGSVQIFVGAVNKNEVLAKANVGNGVVDKDVEMKDSAGVNGKTFGTGANATLAAERKPVVAAPAVYKGFGGRVGIAFDLMSVQFCHLHRLQLYVPAIAELYPTEGVGADIEEANEFEMYALSGSAGGTDNGGKQQHKPGGGGRGGRGGGRGGGGRGGGRGRGRGHHHHR
ncbi:hypothetical protein HDU76_002939 [Blyttiomyces sp. JEL0837]|nr:hypothetical protein HDU76_002939 [Blyttiomyces sp. JEL0837]